MKKEYEIPDMSVMEFQADDVLTTSNGLTDGGDVGEGGSSTWPFL